MAWKKKISVGFTRLPHHFYHGVLASALLVGTCGCAFISTTSHTASVNSAAVMAGYSRNLPHLWRASPGAVHRVCQSRMHYAHHMPDFIRLTQQVAKPGQIVGLYKSPHRRYHLSAVSFRGVQLFLICLSLLIWILVDVFPILLGTSNWLIVTFLSE